MKPKVKKLTIIFSIILMLIVLASILLVVRPSKLRISKAWDIDQSLMRPMKVVDINGDGLLEIIGVDTLYNRSVICIDSKGEILWENSEVGYLNDDFAFFTILEPLIGDVNDDMRVEIITLSFFVEDLSDFESERAIKLSCISSEGGTLWQQEYINATYCGNPFLMDIDSDKNIEIVIFQNEDTLCFNGDGSLKYNFTDFTFKSFFDVENDGHLEFLSSYGTNITCTDLNKNIKWEYQIQDPSPQYLSDPIIADINNDGIYEIIFMGRRNGNIYCLSTFGELYWKKHIESNYSLEIFEQLSIGDLDGDNLFEIIVSTIHDHIYCLNSDGVLKWEFQDFDPRDNSIWACSSTADLDGDSSDELIICHNDNSYPEFLIFNSIGNKILSKTILEKNDNVYNQPCIADIDADNSLEIVVSTSRKVHLFDVKGEYPTNSINWYCSSGSNFNSRWLDSDGDYLDDISETYYSTFHNNPDTDDDSFLDGWEIQVGLNPLIDDSGFDLDNDGLTNFEEAKIYHTSVFNNDTDNDGILDGSDVNLYYRNDLEKQLESKKNQLIRFQHKYESLFIISISCLLIKKKKNMKIKEFF